MTYQPGHNYRLNGKLFCGHPEPGVPGCPNCGRDTELTEEQLASEQSDEEQAKWERDNPDALEP